MSSTYAHYHGPASLPSSYAIVSRLSEQAHGGHEDTFSGADDDAPRPRPRPVMPARSYPHIPYQNFDGPSKPTEATPLLENSSLPESLIEGQLGSHEHESMFNMMREEMKVLTRYSLPVFGSQVLEYSLVVTSVISIGHLSTTALAAISLGSMTASVTGFSVIVGIASALDTMLPSAWTSSEPRLVGLWAQRMTVVMAIALLPVFLIWFNAEELLILLKQDPAVANLAAVYLRWVSLGLPAYAFNSISRRYFQSQGLFAIPTRIIFVAAPLNVMLNYLLVWGPEPIRLGFIGAPIATAISFNFIAIASVIYGIFFVPKTAWHPLSKRMFTHLGVLVRLGLAGVVQTASEWWAWELNSLAASLLGPVSLATQSVLLVSASTTFQAPFSLSIAASVRIGNLLGERKARQAQAASNTALLMALITAAISSSLFVIFRNYWAFLFNDDPEVVTLVGSILPLVALFQVFDANSAVTGGILRARGKQFLGALLNVSAYYILGIPLGVWLAFKANMGLVGLWLGLTSSLVYCSAFGTYLCLRTDWYREVRKAVQRVEGDGAKDSRSVNTGA